jgi:phosphatidylethanolamine-binding protein (PEBP) family uncharacterized protein
MADISPGIEVSDVARVASFAGLSVEDPDQR